MIGVLDSGRGGENALLHLRRLAPSADITLFTDRENLPYGTKGEKELIGLAERGIERLAEAGCERVLIACCTASSVYPLLSAEVKDMAIPILIPTAREALERSRSGRVAVIATDATVRSGAFGRALCGGCTLELAASPLVTDIERGARDGALPATTAEYLSDILTRVAASGADTLILGCTHFGSLGGEIGRMLWKITKRKILTVDSAEVGAREALRLFPAVAKGEGRLHKI